MQNKSAAYRFGCTLKVAYNKHAPLTVLGVGLGMGVGGVHGYYDDDPRESFEHHLLRGARNAAIGGAFGGVAGQGVSRLVNRIAPYSLIKEPFTTDGVLGASPQLRAGVNTLYGVYTHPITRLASGLYFGNAMAQQVHDRLDEARLQQHAALTESYADPNNISAIQLEAAKARKHMGAYHSSLDP